MSEKQELIKEAGEEIQDVRNLLQLLEVNLQSESENDYIIRTVRLAGRMLKATSEKLNSVIEDCENI